MNRIAKVEKLSPGTVAAMAKREHKSVDAVQTLTAGLTSYASQACLERIIDKLDRDEIPAGVLLFVSVSYGTRNEGTWVRPRL